MLIEPLHARNAVKPDNSLIINFFGSQQGLSMNCPCAKSHKIKFIKMRDPWIEMQIILNMKDALKINSCNLKYYSSRLDISPVTAKSYPVYSKTGRRSSVSATE